MRKEMASFLPGSCVDTAVFSRCSLSKMRAPRQERSKYDLKGNVIELCTAFKKR